MARPITKDEKGIMPVGYLSVKRGQYLEVLALN